MSALTFGIATLALLSGGFQAKDPDDILKAMSQELSAAGNDLQARSAASAKVRTMATEAVKGLEVSTVPAAKAYSWAQIAQRAQEFKVIPALITSFLTTYPTGQTKFSALSLGVIGAGYTEDFAAGRGFLNQMVPENDQQRLSKVSSALNWLGDLYVKNLGLQGAVDEVKGLLALLPATAEGNMAASLDSVKSSGYTQIADFYIEAGKKEEAIAALNAGEAAVSNANAKRGLTTKKAQYSIIGTSAPEISVGKSIGDWKGSLEKYRGKVVLLDFFAHWCGPCKASFGDLRKTYADLAGKGLEIVHATRFYKSFEAEKDLTEDAEFAKMQGFVKQHELAWPVVFVDNAAYQAYGVSGIPHMILIDQQGKVIKHKIGYSAQSWGEFRTLIEQTLARG